MSIELVTPLKAITLAALPAIGGDLDGIFGGTYIGLTTAKDGSNYAVVLRPARTEDLTWQAAMDWAKKQGGELPTRPVAALLYANAKAQLSDGWHWTNETDEDDSSFAWNCNFYHGSQLYHHKSYEASVVAVRLIPLIA